MRLCRSSKFVGVASISFNFAIRFVSRFTSTHCCHNISYTTYVPIVKATLGTCVLCPNPMFLLLVARQLIDVGTASTTSAQTVRKVTVVTSTSPHSTRRPHRTTVSQDNHIMLKTLCLRVSIWGQDSYLL